MKRHLIIVVGQQEQNNGTINIRTRDNKQHGEFSIDQVIQRFRELAESRSNHAEEEFAPPSAEASVAGASASLRATTIDDADSVHDKE